MNSKVSVVMSVYNAEKYVGEAVESVLQQSFEDFEFFIVDDGSTDRTIDIIKSFHDSRLRLEVNVHDYIDSLNRAFSLATGKYIARMDADDIMNVDRLRVQYALMEEVEEITVCGSWMLPIVNDTVRSDVLSSFSGFIDHPLVEMVRNNLLFHPTTFIRRSFLEEYSLCYDREI